MATSSIKPTPVDGQLPEAANTPPVKAARRRATPALPLPAGGGQVQEPAALPKAGRTKEAKPIQLPPGGGQALEPLGLPAGSGRAREAHPAPMQLMPGPIAAVVYVALFCAAAGYLALLVSFVLGYLKDAGPLTIFGLHTVGVFGLLLRYFGGSLKVTATSAQTGG